jgi:hypothetical protein
MVFQCVLQFSIDRTVQYGKIQVPPVLDNLGIMFDESPPSVALRFHQLYAHSAAKHRSGKILSRLRFGKSEKFTPIQAADMLAYTTCQYLMQEHFPKQLSKDEFRFPILPAFLRLIENVAADGGMFTDRALDVDRTGINQQGQQGDYLLGFSRTLPSHVAFVGHLAVALI